MTTQSYSVYCRVYNGLDRLVQDFFPLSFKAESPNQAVEMLQEWKDRQHKANTIYKYEPLFMFDPATRISWELVEEKRYILRKTRNRES